ncbi:threonine aldolase family protein [Oceanobacillus saliphilus]|uniref:threonine aldolase family protein n=1 Tax=Oceanobacillus saliphilus TaxID=2925834 RepID=UPI00201D551C
MIDLRSDTVTQPTAQMMEAILQAELGDDGRTNAEGKGEDATVNALENLAAKLTRKEDALFCNSGTMANHTALLTYTKRNGRIGVDPDSHIYQSERAIFQKEYFGREPVFFRSDETGRPLLESIDTLPKEKLGVLCLENTFSSKGGTCISAKETAAFCKKANEYNLPVHIDGARIFNAATHFNTSVKVLAAPAASIQFCLSKGLGAPVGSVLCGSKAFISEARKVRKLIGGGMRQAGVIAAAGIEALKRVETVHEDNEKAYLLKSLLHMQEEVFQLNQVESNIVLLNLSKERFSAEAIKDALAEQGLKVKTTAGNQLCMTTHKDVTVRDIEQAAAILNTYFAKIKRSPV